jgi:Domain of unknown function (DUF4136)
MTRTALAAALSLTLAGCATLKIDTEYVEGADFKKYRSFSFLTLQPGPEQAPVIRDAQVRERIRFFVARELLKRGFVQAPEGVLPDFFIAMHGWSGDQIAIDQYGYGYGAGFGYPAGGAVMVSTAPAVQARSYRSGTLILDFVDATSREMFWRGTGSDSVSPEQGPAALEEAIVTIIDAYPPGRR